VALKGRLAALAAQAGWPGLATRWPRGSTTHRMAWPPTSIAPSISYAFYPRPIMELIQMAASVSQIPTIFRAARGEPGAAVHILQ
jgi:hypothetical protein